MVSYPPANEVPSKSSSGEEERIAKNDFLEKTFNASSNSFFCESVNFKFLQIFFTMSHLALISSSLQLRKAFHSPLFVTVSSQSSKKSTAKANPFGTGKFS